MKYLYTTKPDDHCHEFEPGIYGRPAHTTEQPKLRKAGWVYHINELKEAGNGLRKDEEEGRKEEVEVSAEDLTVDERRYLQLVEEYRAKFGKDPHHKMKAETIRKKVESDG
jgi:hypothetical protein